MSNNKYSSLFDFFCKHAKECKQPVIYTNIETTRETNWAEIYTSALKIAKFLKQNGLKQGDTVGLMVQNRPEWYSMYIGIIAAGGCAIPIDIHLSAKEVLNLVTSAKPRFFFSARSIFAKIRSSRFDELLEIIVLCDAKSRYLSKCFPLEEILEINADDFVPGELTHDSPASLIFTSGTTASPKGVLLTHGNFLTQPSIVTEYLKIPKGSRYLVVLPMNHCYGFMTGFLAPLVTSSYVVMLDSLKGSDFMQVMREYRIQAVPVVPAILNALYRNLSERMNASPNAVQAVFHMLKSIEYFSRNGLHLYWLKQLIFKKVHQAFGGRLNWIVSGGASLDEEVGRTFNTLGLPVYEGYGLTETSPVAAVNHRRATKPGTVGKPIDSIDVKLVYHKKADLGEVAFKGPSVFSGYVTGTGKLDRTPFDSDGYFMTGDLGVLDKKGFLKIMGRSKDIIVLASGKKVFPDELEEHFLQSEFIKEVAIVGVPHELEKKDEDILAVVVPNDAAIKAQGITEQREFIIHIIAELSEALPTWWRPHKVEISDTALPRTSTRKVKKFVLISNYLESLRTKKTDNYQTMGEDALLNSPAAKLVDWAITKTKDRKISYRGESNLFLDLGFDSITVSEFVVFIESKLGASIPKETLYKLRSVTDCITAIQEFCQSNHIEIKVEELSQANEEVQTAKPWSEILSQPVQDVKDEIERQAQARARGRRLLRRLFVAIFAVLGKILFRLEVKGLENVPKSGPFVFAANHASYMDPLFMQWALPNSMRSQFVSIGKKEHLKYLSRLFFIWLVGMIPVDREGNFLPALQMGKRAIDDGNILVIFPEGTPTMDGKLNTFRNGVGILGDAVHVPIVPVYLEGTGQVLRKDWSVPRLHKVKVRFGKPMVFPYVSVDAEAALYKAITVELESKIVELGAVRRS